MVVAPVRSVLQPQLKGLGDLEPIELRTGRDRRPRRGGAPAGRHRVRPHRPGHQARRVRRPRRHPRRLPADRGAPAAGRVLGRRGRGDPHLRRRRPAHHRQGRPAVGAAVPGAAAHRRVRAGPPRWRSEHPAAGRDARQARRGHPGRGHGVAGAGAAGRPGLAGAAADCLPAGDVVLLCDPERIRTRAHDLVRTSEEFLQASWAAAGVGGKAPIDLGAAAFKSLAEVRGRPPPGPAVVVGEPVRRGRDRTRRPTTSRGGSRSRICCRRRARTPARRSAWRPAGAALPRRDRPGRRRPQALVGRRLAGGAGLRGARPGQARGRGAPRRRPGRANGRRGGRARPPPGEIVVTTGGARARLRRRGEPARGPHRRRHHRRARGVHKGHAQDAEPAAQHDRPAGAAGRRLRGARAARHRPVRGDGAAHGQRGRPRVPRHRVRASKRGQPGDRLFVPTDSLDQLSRYVGGETPTLHKMGGCDWQKAKARARKAVREIAAAADPALRGAAELAGPRLRPGHARGSASWRTPSRTPRRPTSSSAIDEVKADMEKPSRWTG